MIINQKTLCSKLCNTALFTTWSYIEKRCVVNFTALHFSPFHFEWNELGITNYAPPHFSPFMLIGTTPRFGTWINLNSSHHIVIIKRDDNNNPCSLHKKNFDLKKRTFIKWKIITCVSWDIVSILAFHKSTIHGSNEITFGFCAISQNL
jgi:hypothetical protein